MLTVTDTLLRAHPLPFWGTPFSRLGMNKSVEAPFSTNCCSSTYLHCPISALSHIRDRLCYCCANARCFPRPLTGLLPTCRIQNLFPLSTSTIISSPTGFDSSSYLTLHATATTSVGRALSTCSLVCPWTGPSNLAGAAFMPLHSGGMRTEPRGRGARPFMCGPCGKSATEETAILHVHCKVLHCTAQHCAGG